MTHKSHIISILFLISVYFASIESSFKCPILNKYNTTDSDISDICICFTKQKRIQCRHKIYDISTFDLVSDYMDYVRRSLTYDKMHLTTFVLCINVEYGIKLPPLVRIVPELMSELNFDHIIIVYCDHDQHTKPIVFQLDPNFLSMQSETLIELDLEIPSGKYNNDSEIMLNLARAVKNMKRMTKMVLWMDKELHLHIPANMFNQYHPFSNEVPLTEIIITNHHWKENEQRNEVEGVNQLLSIGSNAFLNLKWLKLITLQNLILDTVDAYAFASLYPISHTLTINFTTCNLQHTKFNQKAFHNLNRETTIYFGNLNLLNLSQQPYIPSEETFGDFLLQNPANKLTLNYKVNCANKEVTERIKWMINGTKYGSMSTKQFELLCASTGRSIFAYKFKL